MPWAFYRHFERDDRAPGSLIRLMRPPKDEANSPVARRRVQLSFKPNGDRAVRCPTSAISAL